ncbi:hypothetical protein [Rubrivirga marina]|uniref:Apea-like HEPN domain-containing protein n=1 Tax=Rubrivirga marina TaxID=1196024 RepID=A0A271J401_9BACT|nr:hypothetical protein [Rubrivirga marina]PAP78008.1 hypothetical protein BSZ37_16955 [Rubrivirga marina]
MDTAAESPAEGSPAYRVLRASLDGVSSEIAHEYPFYSDAHVIGVASQGPFALLNPARGEKNPAVPAVFLRVDYPGPRYMTDLPKPEGNDHYHGGGVAEEIAALTSLELGVRLKAGSMTRRFENEEDPRGNPFTYGSSLRPEPNLLLSPTGPVIPTLLDRAKLDTRLLSRLAALSASDSIKLARCARLYQDAVWVADSTPELSWLLLVSAVETAAVHWRTESGDPYEAVRNSGSELVLAVREAGGEVLLKDLAPSLAKLTGATTRFVKFLLEFGPRAPTDGHEVQGGFTRLDWSRKSLSAVYSRVYDLRSRALHDGHPFPYPMCVPPRRLGSTVAETPFVTGALGASWELSEVPILLATFERIARESLLKYWLGRKPPPGAA